MRLHLGLGREKDGAGFFSSPNLQAKSSSSQLECPKLLAEPWGRPA